jgi:hypothetical protein
MERLTPETWQSLGRSIRLLVKLGTEFQRELEKAVGAGIAEPKQMAQALRFLRDIQTTLRHTAVANVRRQPKGEDKLAETEEAFAVEMNLTAGQKKAIDTILADDGLRQKIEEARFAATVAIVKGHLKGSAKSHAEKVARVLSY